VPELIRKASKIKLRGFSVVNAHCIRVYFKQIYNEYFISRIWYKVPMGTLLEGISHFPLIFPLFSCCILESIQVAAFFLPIFHDVFCYLSL